MKTEIISPAPNGLGVYPFLGKAKDGTVVFFTAHGLGIVLVGSETNKLGEISEDWNMLSFTIMGVTTIKFD